jgi:hypothetical protein
MRTTYSFSDFAKTYPDIAKQVEEGMHHGVMHYLYHLDACEIVPTPVISSLELVAVEWKPQNVPTLTLTVCVYLINDMFFVDSIDIQHCDISNQLLNQFMKNDGGNYVIEFYEEKRQKDLPDIVQDKLDFNRNLVPNKVRHHTLLSYTKNTQHFHDVLSFSEAFLRDYDFTVWQPERYHSRLDHD